MICVKDILDVTGGSLIYEVESDILNTEIKNVIVDSRKADEYSLFVAIPGEKVDPHKFVPEVAKNSKAIIVEEDEAQILEKAGTTSMPRNVAYIRVNNSLDALQSVGALYRSKYTGRIVGVTGSVGKTTTREMITTALSSVVPTFHTDGNMNSQIGVPLTLSRILDEPTEMAVIEMGISEPGGMDKLTAMVKPDVAVVTIIGDAHIEFLKTREGIREEKLRITGRMNEDGAVFLNADDPLLYDMHDKMNVNAFTYGTSDKADYRAEDISFKDDMSTYTYVHGDERIPVVLNVLGKHNILNSLAAMAVCDYLGLDKKKVVKSFENFVGMRQKIIQTEAGYTIVDDSYNASPDSMKAALNVLRDMKISGRRIAVLGDMFELGTNSKLYHKEVGEYAAAMTFADGSAVLNHLVTIGNESKLISDAFESSSKTVVKHFDNKADAVEYIKNILKPEDVITLKASNGMKFSEIVSELK